MSEVRDLLPSDREFLAKLLDTSAGGMTYNADFTRNRAAILRHVDRLMDPTATVAVLGLIDGKPAGGAFAFLATYYGTDVLFMLGTSVTIAPEYQGTPTLALRLLKALHEKGKKLGVHSSVTHTLFSDARDTMDRLLLKTGYTEAGRAYRMEL